MLKIDLSGQVVLVLGGSRGIGAGITETLGRAGAHVVFTHRGRAEHQARLNALLANVTSSGGSVEGVAADACDPAQTREVVASIISRRGRLDGLVCNVGQTLRRTVEEVTDESWRRFIDINVTANFVAIQATLPHMVKAGRGRIVLIGSSAVYDGGGGAIDYAAGKSALGGMMVHLVRHYASKGVLTNTVHPCVIDTDMLREGYDTPEGIERLLRQVPVGRLGTPGDIAALVAFLMSPLAGFICGQSILVDGGRTFFR